MMMANPILPQRSQRDEGMMRQVKKHTSKNEFVLRCSTEEESQAKPNFR